MASNTQERDSERSGLRPALEQLDRALDECAASLLLERDTRKAAFRRARAELDAAAGDPRAAGVALLAYASELLVSHAVELAAHRDELIQLIDRIEAVSGIPRTALAREVLGAPPLLQLPAAIAIEVQLALLLAFVGAEAVSLWTTGRDGAVTHIAHSGEFDAKGPQTRRLARRLLQGEVEKHERVRDLAGIVVERWQQPAAALIARGKRVTSLRSAAMLRDAVPMLSAILERDELLARGSGSEQAALSRAERRLARLRFDLHDGPQQDVILLAEDIRLLRSQLESMMDGRRGKARVLGRLDELEARLVAIDGDLRRISAFVQSPFLQSESVPDALTKLADEFAARAGIEPELRLDGDFAGLTDSQQITLLGLIREALSNAREHGDARHVTITVTANADGVEATVTDDGVGFDPESTLVKAAREGHLGLVGMHERVHLLGGRTLIDSRPGGPTVISVSLPPWTPASPSRAEAPSATAPVPQAATSPFSRA